MTTRVSISQVFDLSVDDVFDFFGDHEKFGSLLPVPVTRIVNSPDENPNGVGSVRKVGIGPLGVEETILTWNQSSQIQQRCWPNQKLSCYHFFFSHQRQSMPIRLRY